MPATSNYPSPLLGYENAPPLPTEISADGKSLVNIKPGEDTPPPSKAYDEFGDPIDKKNNGFDFHVYFMHMHQDELKYARELHERIRREFPELRIYRLWEKPIGPHPTGMFEVNTFNPHQTGALFSWLTIHRGPCSVLVHPNTGNALHDHTELMAWIGKPWPLHTVATPAEIAEQAAVARARVASPEQKSAKSLDAKATKMQFEGSSHSQPIAPS